MTDRELLKMALHALKFSQNMKRCFARAEQDYHEKIAPITINALEAALAQPEQEPVAWKDKTYGNLHHQNFGNSIPLYTAPPSKPWVSLTMRDYHEFLNLGTFEAFKAIEAALRSKNDKDNT